MRVFLAGTSLLPAHGGPAFSVARLATALADAGAEVGLWAADQSAPSTKLLPAESAVRRLAGGVSQAFASFGKTSVVHDNGLWLAYHHRLVALAHREHVPRIVSTRGMLEPWAVNHKGWKKRIAWRLYQRRDLTSANCHHVTADAEGQNVQRLGLGVPIRMVPNGVDVPALGEIAALAQRGVSGSSPKTALFLGRIYPVKGLPMLVEAWARVRPQGWRLQIAGPDEAGHRAQVERAVREAGLQDVIAFLGPVEGERKTLAFLEADLFVLPTHSESFGMVIAEALAHSLPVLTTTGAPWPALAERHCGWQTAPTVDGVAAGLLQATASDRDTLRAMGARGRTFVRESFGWGGVAKQFLTLYEEICLNASRLAAAR